MKSRILTLTIVLALLVTAFVVSPVSAQVSYGAQFTTSITYQNVGDGTASVRILFYPAGSGQAIEINRPQLGRGAGTSVFVGDLGAVGTGFSGSAVLTADQPLVATMVQVPASASGIKNRPLSNGFDQGSNYVLIPTVLKNTFGSNSIFSVQNVGSAATNVTIDFVPVSGAKITHTVNNLPANAATYIDMGSFGGITAGTFNGSAQIRASGDGRLVATSMELGISKVDAYAFEGATTFGTTVYMPSAFCLWGSGAGGTGNVTSAYAVQNTTASPINLSIKWSNGRTETINGLAAGAKASVNGCGVAANSNAAGFIGSATITGTGNIAAIGKVTGTGYATAFSGFNSGSRFSALPYVRFTDTGTYNTGARQRTFIAIQNVGGALGANTVKVHYYDKNGTRVGTDTIEAALANGAKASSSPQLAGLTTFGYYDDGSFGGSAVVEGPAGSQLAVIGRVQTRQGSLDISEDYNGIPITTLP